MSNTQNKTANKTNTVALKTTTGKDAKTTGAQTADPITPTPTKVDLKNQLAKEKPAMNLDDTLELLGGLQTKMRQRARLLETIENLQAFEIEIDTEEDELGRGGQFNGCNLKIEDDKRNQFKTLNPVVIEAVVIFIKDMCKDRLGEVEAGIVLP